MSITDYDECEKLYCGTWTLLKEENVEQFLKTSGMPEQMASFTRNEKLFSITRDGNCFVEKINIDGVDTEIRLPTFNEEIEWKDKEENPIFHIKVFASFKDGVWCQKLTPLNAGGGKSQVIQSCMEGDELIVQYSLPDVPEITMKRRYKKV